MANAEAQNREKVSTAGERTVEQKGLVAKCGNLATAPELHFKDNKAYCRFRLAVERPKERD
jgi:hypothetical protein